MLRMRLNRVRSRVIWSRLLTSNVLRYRRRVLTFRADAAGLGSSLSELNTRLDGDGCEVRWEPGGGHCSVRGVDCGSA
jgi:hypothetical protein